ncbi:MAG: PaaI family thioesterase [Deltaproteobacteria bacterium]|nr:PaaI family thioesterase [Deltaproteobacteria bacterium]
MPGSPLKTTKGCFGCGTENPVSLGIAPTLDDDGRVRAPFTARQEHRGLSQIAHGGIVATVCDEMMGFAMSVYGGKDLYVTTSLELRFLKAVRLGAPMIAEAWCTSRRGRVVHVRARVLSPDGQEHATACARFLRLPDRLRTSFVRGS